MGMIHCQQPAGKSSASSPLSRSLLRTYLEKLLGLISCAGERSAGDTADPSIDACRRVLLGLSQGAPETLSQGAVSYLLAARCV